MVKKVVTVVLGLNTSFEYACALSPNLILKHHISLVVSLAQLISPSVALPAELVSIFMKMELDTCPNEMQQATCWCCSAPHKYGILRNIHNVFDFINNILDKTKVESVKLEIRRLSVMLD